MLICAQFCKGAKLNDSYGLDMIVTCVHAHLCRIDLGLRATIYIHVDIRLEDF